MQPASIVQVMSNNVGLPREVNWKGRMVETGIFKEAVAGRDDILKRFLKSELTGFYFAVLKEGEVAAGDPTSLLHRDEH